MEKPTRAFATLLLLLFFNLSSQAQLPVFDRLSDWIPDTLQLRGSLQGMAVHDNYAVLLRDGGQCLILDLLQHRCLAAFQLDSNTTHCNNASFSNRFFSPDDPFPLLYVSSCYGDKACLVYRIDTLGATLIQRIIFDSPRFPIAHDWCLDAPNNHIYAYGGKRGGTMHLLSFNLPDITPGLIRLNDSLVQHDTPIECVDIAQGSCISNGLAYLPDGNPGKASLHILDLESGEELFTYNLDSLNLEPEGVAIAHHSIYLSFHTPHPSDNQLLRLPLPF